MHKDLQPSAAIVDWTLGKRGVELLTLQAIPLLLNLFIYALVGHFISCSDVIILIFKIRYRLQTNQQLNRRLSQILSIRLVPLSSVSSYIYSRASNLRWHSSFLI